MQGEFEFLRPPLVFVLFFLFGTAVAGYNVYRVWFHPRVFTVKLRKGAARAPAWYPFRSFYVNWFQRELQRGKYTQLRLLHTVSFALILFMDALMFAALIFGS